MNSIETNILETCIEELKNMSDEEFKKVKMDRGIDEEKYSERSYSQGDVEIVLPGTSEYNKYFEEEVFSKSISMDYSESFQINFEFEMQSDNIDYNMASAA